MFIVMCEKDGGVTGYGRTELKANGVIQEFETREAAQAKATEMDKKMNNMFSIAFYRYWVEER